MADEMGMVLRHASLSPNIKERADCSAALFTAEGEMLGVIFFSLLFGYFTTRIPERYGRTIGDFWQGVYEVMLTTPDGTPAVDQRRPWFTPPPWAPTDPFTRLPARPPSYG